MIQRRLPRDPRFDLATQGHLALWASGLQDQTRRLLEQVEGLDAAALSWQPGPGHNSIGSLLAHLALVELAWIGHVSEGRGRTEATAAAMEATLGVMDPQGFLIPKGGSHPEVLAGWELPAYTALLAKARAAIKDVLLTWTDDSLDDVITLDDTSWSRGWILYHVLEHEAAHAGQVGRLLHDLRDAGLAPDA